jgi:hypothetical protein
MKKVVLNVIINDTEINKVGELYYSINTTILKYLYDVLCDELSTL